MSSTPARKWSLGAKLIITGAALMTLLAGRLFACHFVRFVFGFRQSTFDSSSWKSGWTCSCTPIRMQMAESLLATQHLEGKGKDEITALLGTPDRNAYYQQFEKPGDFVYHLAPHPIVDNYWLVVRFDDAARVKEAAVVMD